MSDRNTNVHQRVAAIVLAAGSGSRMGTAVGGVSKTLVPIAEGASALELSIQNFLASGCCSELVVTAREEELAEIRALLSKLSLPFDAVAIPGGAERQASVYAALCYLEGKAELVAIHDAARPFCEPQKIKEVIAAGSLRGAAILAVPVVATIKRVDEDGMIGSTVDRSFLWEAQTPQVFRYELIRDAHERAKAQKLTATDDSNLLERLSIPVRVVEGSPLNIKLTRPDDLLFAQAIAGIRERKE